jgi:hypothetical protein
MPGLLTARNVIIALSAALLGGLALGDAAHAIVETTFRYSTPQTGYLSLAAAAFTPADPSAVFNNNGATLTTTGTACFSAPVNLPQGAKVTQVAIWYSKNDATASDLTLFRLALNAHPATDTIVEVPAPSTGGTFKSAAASVTDPSFQTVNNKRYSYFVSKCVTDSETFLTAQITYTYTSAGD